MDNSTFKTLILGASLKPNRYSNLALQKFVDSNLKAVGIGLEKGQFGNIKIYTGFPKLDQIHTVTIYMNAQNQEQYIDFIISLNPKRVIFNPGTSNLKLQQLLKIKKIDFENACTLVLLGTGQYAPL